MTRAARIMPAVLAMAGAVSGCDAAAPANGAGVPGYDPGYMGVETRLLDDDLVNFVVTMRNPLVRQDVADYAECAAAQYTLIRGYGFARHVRTNVYEEGGLWRADAVYTISPALPRGFRMIDAEVVAGACAENGIPMV